VRLKLLPSEWLKNMTHCSPSIVPLVILLACLAPGTAHADMGLCDQCPRRMPIDLPGAAVPPAGEWRLMSKFGYAHMEGLGQGIEPMAAGSINPSTVLASPKMGKMATGKYPGLPTHMDMEMASFGVGYSFSSRIFGAVMGTWVRNSMGMEMMAMPAGGSMSMGKTTTSTSTMGSDGFGDTMLAAKYLIYTDDSEIPTNDLSLYFGLSIPTGSIKQGNHAGPYPYMMQLGSGTVDPSWGLVYQSSASRFWWGADAIFTPRFYNNDEGYRLGDRFRYDLYLMYLLGHHLVTEAQLAGYWQDRIHGVMKAEASGEAGHVTVGDPSSAYKMPGWDPANYGGHALWIATGVQWQPLDRWMLELQVGTPLYQYLNGFQLQRRVQTSLVVCHGLQNPVDSLNSAAGMLRSLLAKL
jgi:Putative MetA-pathway of phenol degradation